MGTEDRNGARTTLAQLDIDGTNFVAWKAAGSLASGCFSQAAAQPCVHLKYFSGRGHQGPTRGMTMHTRHFSEVCFLTFHESHVPLQSCTQMWHLRVRGAQCGRAPGFAHAGGLIRELMRPH